VVSVRSHAEAREVIERRSIGAAVLDYLVGDDDVTQLCELLTDGGIPFMFYSGYEGLRAAFPNNVVVQKPAAAADVMAAITGLVAPQAASENGQPKASRSSTTRSANI
jgi:hypothetical protein